MFQTNLYLSLFFLELFLYKHTDVDFNSKNEPINS